MEERIAVVQTRCNQGVYEKSSAAGVSDGLRGLMLHR